MTPNNWFPNLYLFVSQNRPNWWQYRHFWYEKGRVASAHDRHPHFRLVNASWLPSDILMGMNYMYNSKSRKLLKYNVWGFCQSWKSLGAMILAEHTAVLNSFISVLLLIHLKRNTWGRDKISAFSCFSNLSSLAQYISQARVECCLVSLCFFPLSRLSLIYFLVFSLIATVSRDIIKLEWLTSPASVVAYRYFGLRSLDHMTLLFRHIWKERKIWDIPQSELMAQL